MKPPPLLVSILFLLAIDDRAVSINVTLQAFERSNENLTAVAGDNDDNGGLDNMLVSQTINALIKEMTSFCNDNHIDCDLVYKLLRERINNTSSSSSSSSSCSWIDQNLALIVIIVVLKLIILGMSSLLARSHCLNNRRTTARGNVEDQQPQSHELKELMSG